VTVSAAELIEDPAGDAAQVSTNGVRKNRSMRLRPEQSWVNSSFKQAGNIAILESGGPGESRLLVFDGFRTVVELDPAGNPVSRHELPLPEGEAANLIRVGGSRAGAKRFAVFSALGKQVYLFDRAWQLVGTYPGANASQDGIRDCQFLSLDSNQIPPLIVAFDGDGGVHSVNPAKGQGEPVSDSVAMSLSCFDNDMVIAGEGKIGFLKTGLQNATESELQFRRVAAEGGMQICGLGVTDNGTWNAVGFDAALDRVWTLAVGPQFFESQIEPIAVTQSNGELIWAIADTDDTIHLVSGGGKWLGDFQSESRLGGLSLATLNGQTCLIVANQGGVECWNLNLRASPMRPVSSSK
jgi:hypothetical protein